MFVVTVDFLIKEQHVAEFMEAMIKQASHSLNREEGACSSMSAVTPMMRRGFFSTKYIKTAKPLIGIWKLITSLPSTEPSATGQHQKSTRGGSG